MALQVELPRVERNLINLRDFIFMDELRIKQKHDLDNSVMPLYNVTIAGRMFALTEDNYRDIANKSDSVSVNDYMTEALTMAHSGDTRLLNAMLQIEEAVAVIWEIKKPEMGKVSVIR